MTPRKNRDPANVLMDGSAIDRAIVAAGRRTILRHRQLGIPLVIWKDGGVAIVPGDSIEIPDDPGAESGAG